MTELELIQNFRFLTIVGGLAGGVLLFLFLKPKNLGDALLRVVVSVVAANMLTDLVSHKVGIEGVWGDLWGVAFIIGFAAYPLLGSVSLFFEKRKDKDITEIAKDIKDLK